MPDKPYFLFWGGWLLLFLMFAIAVFGRFDRIIELLEGMQ